MNSDDSQTAKNKKTLPEWISSAFSKSLTAGFQTFFVPFLIVILISLISFVLYLNQTYIQIRISIPAYRWGIASILAVLIVYANNKNIRKLYAVLKWKEFEGFFWKKTLKAVLVGPVCIKCKSFIVQQKDSYQQQMKIAYSVTQGVKSEYVFRCSNPNCRSTPLIKHYNIETLIANAGREFLESE